MLLRSLNASTWRADRYRITQAALVQAKEALVARAVADDNRPGSLPCPDTNNDGNAELFAGNECPSYIGRLPWKTLDVPDLRDASGERLWYVLSRSHRDHATAEPVNSNTAGQLAAVGTLPAANLLAAVIAPGNALIRADSVVQERSCTTACNPADFLDFSGTIDNADSAATWTVISAPESQSFNDRVLTISADDVMPLVEKRAGREFAARLRQHYDAWESATGTGFYPWAATFSDPANPQPGTNGNTRGLLPLASTPPVWTSASFGCGGVGTPTITCVGLVWPGIINFLNFSGTVGNVGGGFFDAPGPGSVNVIGGLTLIGTPSPSWALNPAAGTLNFSYDAPALAIGLVTISVQAPPASGWTTSSWLVNNRWYETAYYSIAPDYAMNGSGACGTCLSVVNTLTTPKESVIVMTGRALLGQTPRPVTPPAALADYLEGGNTDPSDLAFEHRMRTAAFNDQPIVVRP